MNRNKRNNLKNTECLLDGIGSRIDNSKANEVELEKLQEENKKLKETIVELAVELYRNKK